MSTELSILEDVVIGSARGRKPKEATFHVVRELTRADLDLLVNPPPKGLVTRPLAAMRTAHHNLARLVAEGIKGVEISARTGYSQSWISILQQDPAFQELVAYYSEQREEAFVDFQQRLASFGLTCMEELQARLEEDPKNVKWRELLEAMQMALDRSVTPNARPSQGGGSLNLKIEFVGKDDGKIVDITPEKAA